MVGASVNVAYLFVDGVSLYVLVFAVASLDRVCGPGTRNRTESFIEECVCVYK
jgi:hypothetical protein